MEISELCTFNDWTAHYGAWGEAGVEKIFDALAVARVKRVYWRGLSGGVAEYPSDVAPRLNPKANTAIFGVTTSNGGIESWRSLKGTDLDAFDPLATAVRIGRERGISVCAWLTIYEEDHGGAHGSPLASNPQFMQRDRAGRLFVGTADFFYPEVQQYKLRVLEELLARGVEGLLLDFVRHNATPSADENGVHRFGYNPEICEAFQAQGGRDPQELSGDDAEWLNFKTKYQTDFLREVYGRLPKGAHKAFMTWGVDVARWLAIDLEALAHEGAVDLVWPVSMGYCNAPREVVGLHRDLARQLHGTPVKVGTSLSTYFGIEPQDFEAALEAADEAGIADILHCESDQLIANRLITSVRAYHLEAPRGKREVECQLLATEPSEADWEKAESHEGFFVATGPDRIHSAWQSAFRVLATPEAFCCRLSAYGEKRLATKGGDGRFDQYAERDAEFFIDRKWYLEALGARMYWRGTERGHLMLDPTNSGRKFFHFVADRAGGHAQQTQVDNGWAGEWEAAIKEPNDELWVAQWKVPWITLGTKPNAGERWTFQLYREQAIAREVSSWFVTTTPVCAGLRPEEWGNVIFKK